MKAIKQSHTSSAKVGMGDSYGSGVRNPIGRVKEVMTIKPIKKGKMGKPPKSMA